MIHESIGLRLGDIVWAYVKGNTMHIVGIILCVVGIIWCQVKFWKIDPLEMYACYTKHDPTGKYMLLTTVFAIALFWLITKQWPAF